MGGERQNRKAVIKVDGSDEKRVKESREENSESKRKIKERQEKEYKARR